MVICGIEWFINITLFPVWNLIVLYGQVYVTFLITTKNHHLFTWNKKRIFLFFYFFENPNRSFFFQYLNCLFYRSGSLFKLSLNRAVPSIDEAVISKRHLNCISVYAVTYILEFSENSNSIKKNWYISRWLLRFTTRPNHHSCTCVSRD